MKKKRLTVFSLLLALTLTLGACDDLEDLIPSGPSSDESGELTQEEDPNQNQNPSDENEGNNPSSNKDVTISFTPSVVTVKENDTAYFSVTLSDEEAYILSVNAEDPTYIEVGSSETINQYYVKGLEAGSTSVIITAGGEGFNTATASISVTVEADSSSGDQGGSGGSSEGGDSGEGGGSGSGGGSGDGGEPGGGEVLTDITLTFEKTDYNLTVGESEVLEFSVSPSDDAISINMASLNGNIASASKNSEGQWCVSAHSSGDTTISVTASGTGYNSATASLSVHVIDGYTYSFSISNKESVPTDWKFNDEVTFTIESTLTTYKNGVIDSSETLTSDVSVSASPEDVVKCDGLTLSPVGVGTATVTVTYNGEYELTGESSDSFTISVADDYKTTHSLSIDKTNLPTEVTIGSDTISLVGLISLTTTTTSLSNKESSSDESVIAQYGDVTIDVTGGGSLTQNGLVLVPSAAGSAVVTVTWTAYADEEPAPTDSFEVTVNPKEDDSYSMTITNKEALEAAWYTEDESRTIEISIMNETQSEAANENNENISVTPAADNIVSVSGLTLTPIGTGQTDVYVEWSEHTDAHATFHVSVDKYSYTLTITTPDNYTGTWDIEDGAKDFGVTLESNNASANTTVSSETLSVTCNDENAFTITITGDGFTLTPNISSTGTHTVTATWIGHDSAVSSITIEITDSIKPVSIQVSPSTLTLEVGQPVTVSAAVYGKDGETLATNQAVEWSASISGIISISTNSEDYSATITAIDYGKTVTLYATSLADHNVVGSCTITTNEKLETGAPVVLPMNKEVIESDPADNSVYVLGTGGFNQYYETGLVTSSYDSATPVRVYKTEGGYLLYIEGQYLKVEESSVSFTSEVNEAAVFSIGNNGITYSDTPLAITSDGTLTLLSSESPLFLVDMVLEETSSLATNGTFYISSLVNGVRKYVDGTSGSGTSLRLTTSTDTTSATEFTIEEAGSDQYYIKRVSDEYYLKLNSSSNYVSFTSSNSGCALTYNENGYWAETTNGKILAYNSGVGNGEISSYAKTNTSYPAAELYAVPTLPELKGITITGPEAELMLGGEEVMSYVLYPTCYTSLTLNWAATDIYGNARNDVTLSGNGTIDIAGNAETSVVNITASYGSIVSNIAQITIIGVSYIESESLVMSDLPYTEDTAILPYSGTLYTLDGAQGSNTSSSNYPHWFKSDTTFRVYSGNTLTFSLHDGVSYPITKVEITYKSSYSDTMTGTTNVASSTLSSLVGTIVPTDGLKSFTVTGTATSRITMITVYYSLS